jgi:DNA-binding protein H-NS
MAKIDLDGLSIEELATLRDNATEKLAEKVAARQAELEAELEKLSQYGKPVKKSQATPIAKPRKDDGAKEPVAKNDSSKADSSKNDSSKAALNQAA